MMSWSRVAVLLACVQLSNGQGPDTTLPTETALPKDMACKDGPNAAVWAKVKADFRKLTEESTTMFKTASPDEIKKTLDTAITEVKAANGFAKGSTECGFGRVIMQLLNVALVDDAAAASRIFRETEILASPTLTILLDVPWVETALSGWPFFGVLAQIARVKETVLKGSFNNDYIDGLEDDATKAYFNMMYAAREAGDLGAMAMAAVSYLDVPSKENIFGPLTALAAQAAVQPKVSERLSLLYGIQRAMRNVLQSVPDLEVALSIRWPLWDLLHFGVDAFATGD